MAWALRPRRAAARPLRGRRDGLRPGAEDAGLAGARHVHRGALPRLAVSQRGPASRPRRARGRHRQHGTEIATRLVDSAGARARVVPHAPEHHAAGCWECRHDSWPHERERAGGARRPGRLPDAAPRLGRPLAIRHAALAVRHRDRAAGARAWSDARPRVRRRAEGPQAEARSGAWSGSTADVVLAAGSGSSRRW